MKACNGVEPGYYSIVWIKNKLELSEVLLSESLLAEAVKIIKHIEIIRTHEPITFVERILYALVKRRRTYVYNH